MRLPTKSGIRRFFRYEPYRGGYIELFLLRLLFVGVLLYKGDFLWDLLHSNSIFDDYDHLLTPVPNGLANIFDADNFNWVYHHQAGVQFWFAIACACFVVGFLTLPAVGYMFVVAVAIGTLRNSQGHVHHGTQMMALTLFALFIGYLTCALKNLWGKKFYLLAGIRAHRFTYVCALQGIAAYYFVAGWAKVEARGLIRWVGELQNMGVYVDRNGHQKYLAGGDLANYERSQMLAAWINDHPFLTMMVFAPGLIFELAAPALLLNRRIAFLFGIIYYMMHILIGYLMQLTFPMNELIILIFLVNIPFLIAWLLRRGWSSARIPDIPQPPRWAGGEATGR